MKNDEDEEREKEGKRGVGLYVGKVRRIWRIEDHDEIETTTSFKTDCTGASRVFGSPINSEPWPGLDTRSCSWLLSPNRA